MSVEPFSEWAIVEIMGHRVFAGFVTEQMIAGRGFIRIDVPEDRTVSYAIVPAYTKVFGTDAVFSLSPCTEETVRRHIAGTGYRMEGAKLLTPPNPVPATIPAPKSESDYITESYEAINKAQADIDEFAKSLGVESITNEEADAILHSETLPALHPVDHMIMDAAGFFDPIDNQPF